MIRFVTGTDEGAGKTVAVAALAQRDVAEGREVAFLKPVQTGTDDGAAGDCGFVGALTGIPTHEAMRFSSRLDPAPAADQAAVSINLEWLVGLARAQASVVDVLYVEGTGGLLAPLSGDHTMAELAQRLGADLIVVTTSGPGTLNKVALTLEAARTRSLHVRGLIVNRFPVHPGVIEDSNLARLRRICPVMGLIPERDGLDTARAPETRFDVDLLPGN
jgi:dethiobiotin synthetase